MSRGTGCGCNGPKWRPVVRQACKGETALCWSKEEEPWHGSDLTIVFQEAVCAEGVSKICLRSVHLLYSCCVGAFPRPMASIMNRSMYPVFADRSFVSCSLIIIIWSWLMLCSAPADLSVCAICMCLLCSLILI